MHPTEQIIDDWRDSALDGSVDEIDLLATWAARGALFAENMARYLDADEPVSGADFIEHAKVALVSYRQPPQSWTAEEPDGQPSETEEWHSFDPDC